MITSSGKEADTENAKVSQIYLVFHLTQICNTTTSILYQGMCTVSLAEMQQSVLKYTFEAILLG